MGSSRLKHRKPSASPSLPPGSSLRPLAGPSQPAPIPKTLPVAHLRYLLSPDEPLDIPSLPSPPIVPISPLQGASPPGTPPAGSLPATPPSHGGPGADPGNEAQLGKRVFLGAVRQKHKDHPEPQVEDEQMQTCLICAETVRCFALGVCSHRTCHVCALRMRVLYKKRDCALCKTDLPELVFTSHPDARFSEFDLSQLPYREAHLSIYCETLEQLDDLLAHLKFSCPHRGCNRVLSNWQDLKSHVHTAHNLVLCDLCCAHKKVFAHEHTLFTKKALVVHQTRGSVGIGKGLAGSSRTADGVPGAPAAEDGFKGHPRCEFCMCSFYDDDELYRHCRDKHEQCFICLRNEVGRWQYFRDYQHLENHFRADHHLCTQPGCLQVRFVVFETAVDLQAHQVEAHGAEISGKASRDARRLTTNFAYVGSAELQAMSHPLDRRVYQRGSGRPDGVMDLSPREDRSDLQPSSANRLVPGLARPASGSNPKPHKGKLKWTPKGDAPGTSAFDESVPSTSRNTLDVRPSSSAPTFNAQKHAALLAIVREAVDGAETKITSFKAAVRTYRNNEVDPSSFLDSLCHILGHHPGIVGTILDGLVDLMDIDDDRKSRLLEKWADLRLQQSQFPSLDGRQRSSAPALAGSASSNANRQGRPAQTPAASFMWPAARTQTSSRARCPPLTASGPIKRNQGVPGLTSRTVQTGTPGAPWTSSSSTSKPVPSASPCLHHESPSFPSHSANQFPSLPTKEAHTRRRTQIVQLTKQDANLAHANPHHLPTLGGPNSKSSSQPQPQAKSGTKKQSKKLVLFTNNVRGM